MIIKHAIIESATLENTDGFLTAWLTLNYGGTYQGFGGICLFNPYKPEVSNVTGAYLNRLLEVADVNDFNKLTGKAIRVQLDVDGFSGLIIAIGHIIKDIWLNPKELLERNI